MGFFHWTAAIVFVSAFAILWKISVISFEPSPNLSQSELRLMEDLSGTATVRKQARLFWNESWAATTAQSFDELDKSEIHMNWLSLFPPAWHDVEKKVSHSEQRSITSKGLSVFHQLDCLMEILDTFLDYNSTNESNTSAYTYECFSYLHATLLCCGDTSLEGSDKYAAASGRNGTLGIGSTHICKSFESFAQKENTLAGH
nr:uncharacterized protein CTRU02_08410 [Colletotrichum truncatum]XP_036587996.1 uncharacterized protein CTRU02_02008 [Colletotrichum truncatum]KAF6790281.1 hypothetical protein CTRU02_08410 [Colletotrichum truncatum]KAF6799137.1 hypothetical protein CTRU02_02008 [Colletotrichum truncatum]